jgi:hypothetical protein
LLHELGKLTEVTNPKLRCRADIRFMRKLESERYPILFSRELKELEAERRRNAELGVELGDCGCRCIGCCWRSRIRGS